VSDDVGVGVGSSNGGTNAADDDDADDNHDDVAGMFPLSSWVCVWCAYVVCVRLAGPYFSNDSPVF
jgi:hypothetical protein